MKSKKNTNKLNLKTEIKSGLFLRIDFETRRLIFVTQEHLLADGSLNRRAIGKTGSITLEEGQLIRLLGIKTSRSEDGTLQASIRDNSKTVIKYMDYSSPTGVRGKKDRVLNQRDGDSYILVDVLFNALPELEEQLGDKVEVFYNYQSIDGMLLEALNLSRSASHTIEQKIG